MTLTQNQTQVGAELGATVTILQQALAQVLKVQGDLQGLHAAALAQDVGDAIEPLQAVLAVLTKDLSVVNDLAAVT